MWYYVAAGSMQYGRHSARTSPQQQRVFSLKRRRKSFRTPLRIVGVTVTVEHGSTVAPRWLTCSLCPRFVSILRSLIGTPLHLGSKAVAGWRPSNYLAPPIAASPLLAAPLTCAAQTTGGGVGHCTGGAFDKSRPTRFLLHRQVYMILQI